MNGWKLALYGTLCWHFFVGCNPQGNSTSTKSFVDTANAAAAFILDDSTISSEAWMQSYILKVRIALQNKIPIMLLESKDSFVLNAQNIALTDSRFTQYLFDKNTKQPLRNEIFNIYQARPSDLGKVKMENNSKYFRVELYNFALNIATIAIVNVTAKTVVDVNVFPDLQPEIPLHLRELAIKLAVKNTKVCKALGYKPGETDALMANTKTALNNTKCERSLHLCVAPTFVKKDKALWAIIDLTDLKLVGIRWTEVNSTGPGERIGERKLKFEKIMECYCKKENTLTRNGWNMKYIITNSDGLKISHVQFKNKDILHSVKLVDWHVSYSGTDGFGYSDAVGCPEFSQAAVVAVSEPKIAELFNNGKSVGFTLEQSFQSELWPQPCNYNYLQRYEFYNDGRFRVAVGSLGRGCGNDGTYRPVIRIFFAGDKNTFKEWEENKWNLWQKEAWKLQSDKTGYNENGYQYLVGINNASYGLEPSKGQFNDHGRGDNAWVFITAYNADKDEGEKDLITIGPCCNTDYRQGPEKFIEPMPESLEKGKFILWYVPQIKNDNAPGREYCWAESYLDNGVYKTKTYPCMAGPMFIPIK